ncbi:DUF2971 domain-containing protein [Bacillus velezensis]|uniref:hypothetical protein n=1 Tax=Bacillus TaxID=1386 RepID=UPI0003A688E8|nr:MULTISPECIES: hypothetical protein [Bacillus]AUJ61300.1 hypothetical protein B6257_12215 [Bacillus velezensis]KZE60722.1 hypothetical protein AV542_17925 [Bacillus amyloliquefaciens]MBD8888236.1 DUF2971 domain-containing protein [Bacillus velezensis]PHQ07498.1 hypothetical protein CJ031_07355 [Bacillus velezensis]UOI91000.1 DUF2971 domain-containing protein [Bacillus amyloliquefaciens]
MSYREQKLNPDVKIWRYLDLSKFIKLLTDEDLYFPRADKFQDPFEGSSTIIGVKQRSLMLERAISDKSKDYPARIFYDGEWVELGKVKNGSEDAEVHKKIREIHFVSCWHENETESEAMWKLYLKSGDGIAIQTTVGRLQKSIEGFHTPIIIDRVNYIDYETEPFDQKHGISTPLFHKRNHFSHEREIRAVFPFLYSRDDGKYKVLDDYHQDNINAIHVPVNDLGTLIQNVYISPVSADWFHEVVDSVLEKFNVMKEDGTIMKVKHSKMKGIPIF